jgi:hypothetical protein
MPHDSGRAAPLRPPRVELSAQVWVHRHRKRSGESRLWIAQVSTLTRLLYTCSVMYCRQRPHIVQHMVVKGRCTICPPPHRSGYFTGGLRCRHILKGHSLHVNSRKNSKSSLLCEMSVCTLHIPLL